MSRSLPTAPLIGRERELATLRGLVGLEGLNGLAGQPRAAQVLLDGDAGIGKSRLLATLGEQAAERGWRIAVGHCLDLGGSPLPYLPFAELATRLETLRPARMAQLADRWPDLRRLLTTASGTEEPAETLDRSRFFGALHAVLGELAREAPLLLIIEDVHWADQSTYDLLSFLLARGFDEPVALVVSYRSDDLHRRHPLRSIAAGWSRLPTLTRLELGPLPDAEVRRLVGSLAAPSGTPDEVAVRAIVERAEGNAFFIEELVAAAGSTSVPQDLAGLLLLRLDRLDPDARVVVRAASAAGRVVQHELLAAVSGLDPVRGEAAVRAAVEANVLVAEEDGYRFRHSLLAEAVYDDLLPGERSRVHRAYARALVALGRQARAADLARHAVAADDRPTAYRASVQAGEDALRAGGPDEAARHFAVALDLLEGGRDDLGVPVGEVVTLTELAAVAAAGAGHVRRAESIVARQLERLAAVAGPLERARLLIALVDATVLSDSPTDVAQLMAEAMTLIPAEPPTLLRTRALATYALALSVNRRDDEAARLAEEGLALPPELRPGGVNTQLQTVLARILERSGEAARSERLLRELAQRTRQAGDPSEVRVLQNLGSVQFEEGNLEAALPTLLLSVHRAVELGRPFDPYAVTARILAGYAAHQLGRWDEALEIAVLGADEVPALARAGLLSVSLAVRAGRGESAGWQEVLAGIRPEWTTEGMLAVHSGAAAIDLAGDAGDPEGSLAIFDDVVSCVTRSWATESFQARIWLTTCVVGQLASQLPGFAAERRPALVQWSVERTELAGRSYAVGRRPERGLESQAWLLRLEAELLRLRSTAGEPVEPAELVAAWRAAVQAFERYGHVFERARSQARLAAALRADGQEAEAVTVAGEALVVAQQLRAAPLVAELRRLVGASSAAGPAASGIEVLTPREREVLLLVRDGRTNRQIGEALFISTKTASVHVSNILAKLGARTRTEAAALAQRRGLLG